MAFGSAAYPSGGLFGATKTPGFGSTSCSTNPPAPRGSNLFGNTFADMNHHICGLYFLDPATKNHWQPRRFYLPRVSQAVHARIVGCTSRTTLTQTFVNPSDKDTIPELRFTFPLYDGVSVVDFTCTVNNDRVIRGVVQERNTARKTYEKAVAKGETAGLLEQLPKASDVFTTTIGNVPEGAEVKVDIVYLGELKHDAEVDGIRFTIPTSIAPRYGSYPGELLRKPDSVNNKDGIQIVVDAEMPAGSVVKSIQSPSHPIAVTVGSTSTMTTNDAPSLSRASATLSLGSAELERDFVVQIVTSDASNPVAVLETHPTDAHQQAIMATLVPKFKLNPTKPEVVFVCDRSGSMGNKIPDLKNALQIFMKSLPVGCMFNICSFGNHHTFLFESSRPYDQDTLSTAMLHIESFDANYGGTDVYSPVKETFKRRHKDMDLEVFVLTDGEIWDQEELFQFVNQQVEDSKGAIRLFTLGVGRDASHALIEGLARAGRGFSQSVSDQEKMSGKVVRMLKGALTPHVTDYSLEVKYADAESETEPEDDFEIINPDSLDDAASENTKEEPNKTISLFDPASADDDVEMEDSKPVEDGTGTDRFSHVPSVKPPKILQAPFQIPPLFPYSRTTVYLLLSPDRALRTKTPDSVIIRGTSPQGLLELQVPVVSVGKGETIHQLAARKAVKELEEGRGWIFHAKAKDGEPLEKKHPGRFASMVEREAVRLGVKFQVGGKWCSFVAVEDNEDSSGDSSRSQSRQADPLPQRSSARPHVTMMRCRTVGRQSPASPVSASFNSLGSSASLNSLGSMQSFGSPVAGCLQTQSFAGLDISDSWNPQVTAGGLFGQSGRPASGGLFGSSQSQQAASPKAGGTAFSLSASQASTTPGGLMGSTFGTPTTGAFGQTAASSGSSLFGARPSPFGARPSPFGSHSVGSSQQAPQLFGKAQPEGASGNKAATPFGQQSASVLGGFGSASQQNVQPNSSLFGSSGSTPRTPAPHRSKFSILVRLQHFSGFWTWSAELLEALGVAADDVNKALAEKRATRTAEATALVVAFLRKKLLAERDSWEMMEEKAIAWLEGEVGKPHASALLAALETLF